MKSLSPERVNQLLRQIRRCRVLVLGDVMLDQFLWGSVSRISPEAPVPVVDFHRESYMPGGAANVARNLTALGANAELFSVVGRDSASRQLAELLSEQNVNCAGIRSDPKRQTSIKTRIIAQHQQMVRVDRETRGDITPLLQSALMDRLRKRIDRADAVVVGDYGKGVVTQPLLDEIKRLCRSNGRWLSLDPKPVHQLDLTGLSLITPNRKEAFELANLQDATRHKDPLQDACLMKLADRLLNRLHPALLLITLGEQGMLLCQRGHAPFVIPTVAREVFDVSGAGDTVIASFTLAIAAGASPVEAAIFSNHAAGVVVGKMGTAVVTPEELQASFRSHP